MNQIVINLDTLAPQQQTATRNAERFNVVAGGIKSGKATLAIDLALSAPLGALRGYRALIATRDKTNTIRVQRKIVKMLGGAITARPRQSRMMLASGGVIDVIPAEELTVKEAYSLVVVLHAEEVDDLEEFVENTITPIVTATRGSAWLFGKASGQRSEFYRMFQRENYHPDWASHVLRTEDNPHIEQGVLEDARETLDAEAFDQECNAVFHPTVIELSDSMSLIGPDETFLMWCERLAASGLKVDEHEFRLDNRPAMKFIYEMIPSTVEEANRRIDVIMKCTQVGFTVMEMLAMIYLALRFSPAKIGMFLPSMPKAIEKSSDRFMPIVRTIPEVHRLMLEPGEGGKAGEGNVMIRRMGRSKFFFAWTSGKATTESTPMDIISFDEVQEMRVGDMEKTQERMSASHIRYTLMGSTANWLDMDIHWWYQRGSMHQFHTWCPSCQTEHILDEEFPGCVGYDDEVSDYRYRCVACNAWIDDPQLHNPDRQHGWVSKNPDASPLRRSVHFPQTLSPTITPRDMIEAYNNADDMKNFYNRKLGKPYNDPSQVPIDMAILNECAQEGMSRGVVWKTHASETFMGIDQMGKFNVVLISERLSTGHMAIIHAEMIYDEDPFTKCSELIERYGVAVCVVEINPNYNDAHRFSKRHPGIVFLNDSFKTSSSEAVLWGDAVPNKTQRKTDAETRDRYTVAVDQYKCMDLALSRIKRKQCLFPDPKGLKQEIIEKGVGRTVDILKDVAFFHFTRTALVTIQDEAEKKFRRKVVKVGIDPHFSYAYMLMSVAWTRAHGQTTFVLPQVTSSIPENSVLNFLPESARQAIESANTGTCGACVSFPAGQDRAKCDHRHLIVRSGDPGCDDMVPRDQIGDE